MYEIELTRNGDVVQKVFAASVKDLAEVLNKTYGNGEKLAEDMLYLLGLLGNFYTHTAIVNGSVFSCTVRDM